MKQLSHTDDNGKARMVDVSSKIDSLRTASAKATMLLSKEVFELIEENKIAKGDVLTVAKIAGIQAAKKTSDLIPLCHNIFISDIDIDFILNKNSYTIDILSKAKTFSKTGIEMEALTAVSVAGLTIYDMCKGVDKTIRINDVKLISKSGGKSGDFNRAENE